MNNIKKNYKRLNNVISYINNKYYIGKLYLLIDIFICKIKYKANLNDYKMFSMYLLNNKERKTLLTSGKNLVLANKLNNNSQLHIFLYKNEFNSCVLPNFSSFLLAISCSNILCVSITLLRDALPFE